MADKDDLIQQAKLEAFGEHADKAIIQQVGSGISETQRISLDLLANPALLNKMPAPWTENRAMIVKLFEKVLQHSHICPGAAQPQCCGVGPGQHCSPNWQIREDLEWYALEINKYLGLVDWRLSDVTPTTAALAADEAFELGCLLTEALIKSRWDKHAKRGKHTVDSASQGGQGRRKRANIEITVHAVAAQIAEGKSLTRAYEFVGKQQGVSAQTVGKEYRKAKKQV